MLLLWGAFLIGLVNGEIVETPSGTLSGSERKSRDGRPYLAWTKIPYAKPPVGPLRLAAPLPFGKWEGVLDATELQPFCVQGTILDYRIKYGQEDCLYLNVYRPKNDLKNLPVLVFVHGGGFIVGHPGTPDAADFLMDEDVILVTLTYRLGALGFLSLGTPDAPGNLGLKDQALALRWVHENILSFGGNSTNINIFGESAGGTSVHYLMLSPLSRDYVTRGYAISGVRNEMWGYLRPELVVDNSNKLAKRVGCSKDSPKETAECLRQVGDPLEFIEPINLFELKSINIPFSPTMEPEGPEAFMSTNFFSFSSDKPLMASFAEGEYLLLELANVLKNESEITPTDVDILAVKMLDKIIQDEGKLKDSAAKLKEEYFKGERHNVRDLIHQAAMVIQDGGFVYPALHEATSNRGPVWLYQFAHLGKQTLYKPFYKVDYTVGVHADDLFYLLNRAFWFPDVNDKELTDPNDLRVSRELVRYFVNFAKHGDPTPEGSPFVWPQYTGNEILRIKSEKSEMADSNFVTQQNDIYEFWKSIL